MKDIFTYELECAYCGYVHAPIEIEMPDDNKAKIVWKPNCSKCGRENELHIHPINYRSASNA